MIVATPATASAHLRSGTIAVDYHATIVHPDTAAYTAQIFQSDRALTLTIKPHHAVELIGYLREPVFRLDDAGLAVNRASPTAAALRLIDKSNAIDAPTPRWQLEPGHHTVVWHDARTQALPPGTLHGPWRVPIAVNGRRTHLQGELRRYPAPALWPWLTALAILLLGGVALALLPRRVPRDTVAIGAAVAATGACAVLLPAFALDSYASPGTWIEALDSLAFLAVGTWVLLRGPTRFHLAAALGMGLVGLAVGLLEGAVFFHPIVLAVLPATTVRAAALLALGGGIVAVALGAAAYTSIGWSVPADEANASSSNPTARMRR